MLRIHAKPLGLLGMGVLLLTACGGSAHDVTNQSRPPEALEPPAAKLQIVATNPLLAEFAQKVGEDLVDVTSLVPPGADAHSFQLKPSHSYIIGQADVLLSNGGGLDDFLNPVLGNSARDEAVWLVLSHKLDSEDPLVQNDPHYWLDPRLALALVDQIRQVLTHIAPIHEAEFAANAHAFAQQIEEMEADLDRILSSVPPHRRHLVTFHDGFGHFAHRYGWETTALVLDEAHDVTPAALSRVLAQIREKELPAIFLEPQFQQEALTLLGEDAGLSLGVVYSLPGPGAPTYLEMMRFNAQSLARELG